MTAGQGALSGLPSRLPIFPLTGAILLPGGNLPLNVFEPRYLQMTRDAMRTDKVIGMIQPNGRGSGDRPDVFQVGCVGRISSFTETDDGRYLITLAGICRFDVAQELPVATPYRQVVGSYDRWRIDLEPPSPCDELRPCLLAAVRAYFDALGISTDWNQIEAAPLAGLVTSLAMICPFEPSEKQALLEADDCAKRVEILTALMQIGACGASLPEAASPQ